MKEIGTIYYNSTVPEPGEADHIRFVDVDQDQCIGCKHCNDIYPTGAIRAIDSAR